MELLIEAKNWEHAKFCIENNVDNLILGNELFATRISYSFNESEIQELINHRNNTKIWIKVNKFFFEQEIDRLTMYLNWLSSLDIEKVIFQDYAIVQISKELNLKLNFHYNPETLVTSYGQFDFYLENNINSVFVAREITWKELEEITKNKQQMQLTVQLFGYGFIMHSRWNLITNFLDHYHLDNNLKNKPWMIKEHLRKLPNVIFEDNHGTHMFTGYIINAIKLINQFKELNIDYLLVDFINLEPNICNPITKLLLTTNHQSNDELQTINEQINHLLNDQVVSLGFYDCPKSVLHLIKEDTNE